MIPIPVMTRCPLHALRLVLSRSCSSQSAPVPHTPPAAVSTWISHLLSSPATIDYDTLDLHRATQLHQTLPTRQSHSSLASSGLLKAWDKGLNVGDNLDPGWGLIYFKPKGGMEELGKDGSWTTYNPPSPFTRRMWASGSFHFPASSNHKPPRIGQNILQSTGVSSVEYKKGMVWVEVEKKWFDAGEKGAEGGAQMGERRVNREEGGLGEMILRETRMHVFREELNRADSASASPPTTSTQGQPSTIQNVSTPLPPNPSLSFTYLPTPPLLFLFSALTHNPHRIHYDHLWATQKEGMKGCLVHGPLTGLMGVEMVVAAAREMSDDTEGSNKGEFSESIRWEIEDFEYRLTGPMVVGTEIEFGLNWDEEEQGKERKRRGCTVWAQQDGKIGMKAKGVVRRISPG